MNLKKVLIKVTAMVAVVFSVVSCDDDFNSVGSEVIGGVNFQDNEYNATPIAYSKRFERVQTSALPNYLIGVYNDPVYGQSTYNVLSQVLPDRFSPTFGRDAILDSVVLRLPYFSDLTETETNDDGDVVNTFEIDSVYGSSAINLSVYKSDYFLRDFDVDQGSEVRQVYFSNDIIENFGPTVEERLLFSEDNFRVSSNEIRLLSEDTDIDEDDDPQVSTITPGLRLALLSTDAAAAATALNPDPDNDGNTMEDIREGNQELINYFTTLFLDKEGSLELSNANNFHNFFRGIYFKAEAITTEGTLVFFDIAQTNITLHYSFETDNADTEDEDGDGDVTELLRDTGELVLNFSNNVVNSIETNFNTTIEDELASQDEINGEENLYLKGGEGSYIVVDLFNGDILNEDGELENELDFLRRQNWLINEASMKFYINQDAVISGDAEPERIYIFNVDTGEVLVDYQADPTSNAANPIVSIIEHLEPIARDSDDNGEFYKIKLTRHIINLLNEDEDNLRLGVSVSQNVNVINTAEGFTPTNTEDEIIPFSSVISHEGTILYGNGANVPEEKRLKLDIFYTESTTN
ncbi:DUF4270 domain-containing protein [uncultured Aquimarina sp.]|uniref:DUF4270 domain-containing protein n=1 Tax=uncultured Aquimarina sp. TaxID=575652 RepID=UPI0026133BED|nr:DUF4270 domain-containing protein [uncultured Aquimarina sp.]